jgi:apolipoprotein N-acyltransferase
MGSLSVGVTARDGLWATVAGFLCAAAFPPLGLWPLALVGVALLLWVLRDHDAENGLNIGLLYGAVYGLGTIYWFFFLFGLVTLGLMGLFALYFGVLGMLIGMTKDWRPIARAALAGIFAVGIEWLRGDAWYLRFPWYTIPHALAQSPVWIAPTRWLGTYGLSFAIWFILALGLFYRPWVWATVLLLPACSLLLPVFDPPDRRALLMQTEELYGVEKLIPRAKVDAPVDLALLPEYSYFDPYPRALASKIGPAALARRLSCPVIFGAKAEYPEDLAFENVAVVLDADGKVLGTFTKQRPVPLMNDGRPGTSRPVFALNQGTLGVAVCYDFDAPEVPATLVHSGATVLVAPTYDAMDWSKVQHVNHELLLRLRAVENDRWIVRTASSGRSEVIDPHGRPSAEGIEIGEQGTIVLGYGHRHTQTLGSWTYMLGPAAAAMSLVFGTWWAWKRRREQQALDPLSTAISEKKVDG